MSNYAPGTEFSPHAPYNIDDAVETELERLTADDHAEIIEALAKQDDEAFVCIGAAVDAAHALGELAKGRTWDQAGGEVLRELLRVAERLSQHVEAAELALATERAEIERLEREEARWAA